MKILTNARYYLNYLYFNRGDAKIRAYFSTDEYNKAVKELAEEGYLAMLLEFQTLVKNYANIYPLNTEESSFITQVENKYKTNYIHPDYDSYSTIVYFVENFLGTYKGSDIGLEKEFRINFIKCELELYKKELQKTLPIFEALIMRRFVKKFLELLIIKNISFIYIDNYSPSPTILVNYKNSVHNNYFFREGNNSINIEKELEKEISEAESLYEK